jgi:cytochrome c biogenesis protein ResB
MTLAKFLSSLKLFYGLCGLLAAAFVYQTLFNKGPSVYAAAWFSSLGLLLAFNIAACAGRRAGAAPLHYLLIHSGLVLVLLGAFSSRAFRFEAQMPLRAGEAASLAGEGKHLYRLPFSVQLKDFRIEYHAAPRGVLEVRQGTNLRELPAVPGAALKDPPPGTSLEVVSLLNDFGLSGGGAAKNKSPYWNNPAAQVRLGLGGKKKTLWVFSNFPGMHGGEYPFTLSLKIAGADIKGFVSSVTVTPAEGAPFDAEIAVNKPLRTGGYTLYQSSYDPADAGYSLLTVTRDRGAWIVYAGFAGLLAGILLWLKK